ncbi:MAG: hypothetical protein D6B25_03310 [Desulfobulbaceae bacterium]|nr:MAG: hypothetical protein D6B25_03310 [Desulfobulbaceae bacterium]
MHCKIGIALLVSTVFFMVQTPNVSFSSQENIQQLIDMINQQIQEVDSEDEKAKLCCHRARNHLKLKDIETAEQDYLEALELSYSGWILNEYSYFLYRTGEYQRAYRASQKVLEDFPHLSGDAGKLKKIAYEKYQEEYREQNPITIIMDTPANTNRVTRHDLLKKTARKDALIFSNVVSSSGTSSKKSTKKSAPKKKTVRS